MKSKILFIISVVLLLQAQACNNNSLTKSGYVSDLENWISDLKTNYKYFKDADWSRVQSEFKNLEESGVKFKEEFTEAERERVDNLMGKYYGVVAKHKCNELKDQIKSMVDKAEGMFEELKKE